METNNDETCNGWTNYETWKVATILINDEYHYTRVSKLTDADAIKLYCGLVGIRTLNVNFTEIAESF